MKIAYNPKTAVALTAAPSNNDITFDLPGLSIYVKGVKFDGKAYSIFKKYTSATAGGYNGLVPAPSYNDGSTNRFLKEDGTWGVPEGTGFTIVSSTASGLAPKIGTAAASTVTTQADEWVLTSTKGATPTWRKLPTNAFLNYYRPILVNGTSLLGNNNTALNIVAGTNINLTTDSGKVTINNGLTKVSQLINDSGYLTSDSLNNYVTLNTDQEITGTKTFTKQLKFTVAKGTAPFYVTSDTNVTNLNADLLDGLHGSEFCYTISGQINLDCNKPTYGSHAAVYRFSDLPSNAFPAAAYGNMLVVGNGYDTMYQLGASYHNDSLYFRSGIYKGGYTGNYNISNASWKRIAFTDSNITGNAATADKLKTKRKLWGLNFDGSSDVNGTIYIGKIHSLDVKDRATLSVVSNTDIPADIMLGSNSTLTWALTARSSKEFNRLELVNQSNAYRTITITLNDYMGIGITSPSQRLEVNGNVKASTFLGNLDWSYITNKPNYYDRFPTLGHGVEIPSNADLNTETYLNKGNYYCRTINISETLQNCPVKQGFLMSVYYLGNYVPTSTYLYRVRKITTHQGEEWILRVYCGSNAEHYIYEPWKKTARTDDTYPTNQITALTGYTKATSASDLVTTDTLNIALGKLEYKAGIAYSWYRTITEDDTDEIINKWDEVVDFVNNLEVDLTEEFVTRKTELTIIALKTFNTNIVLGRYSDTKTYSIVFPKPGSGQKFLTSHSGDLKFGESSALHTILHEGNYNNYAPKLDGVGATGDWNINIKGSSSYLTHNDTKNTNKLGSLQLYYGRNIPYGDDVDEWNSPYGHYDVDGVKVDFGSILRIRYAPKYYHDLWFDANLRSISFRQIINNVSYGWKTLLDSSNFSGYLDDSYVKKTGDTISGLLGFSGTIYPHIYGNGSFLILGGKNVASGSVVVDSGHLTFRPYNTSTSLGNSPNRWLCIYSQLGDFSGQITSTVADGTAPFIVASKTRVINLNADYVGDVPVTKLMSYIERANTDINDTVGNKIISYAGNVNPFDTTKSHYGAILQWTNNTNQAPSTPNSQSTWYYQLIGKTLGDANGLYFRRQTNGLGWSGIKEVAFIDSDITGNAATADKLKNKVKLWGNDFDGTADINGDLIMQNGRSLIWKSTSGSNIPCMLLQANNNLAIGGGVKASGARTIIYGGSIELTTNSTAVHINNAGNIGIGTTSPTYKLHVKGDIAYEGALYMVGNKGEFVDSDGTSRPWYGIHWNDLATNRHNKQMISNYYGMTFHSGTSDTKTIAFAFAHGNGDTYKENVTIDGSGNTYIGGITTSTGFKKQNSSDSYVLLGGGGHKAISDFLLKSEIANQELSANLTTITKELTVTQDWMDTGIAYNNLPANGTYVVLVYVHALASYMWECYWSGVMTWHITSSTSNRTNDEESDEIILHRSGHAYHNTIYLRTKMTKLTSNGGTSEGLKLLIAANKNLGAAYTYTFKFKRII